jgi:hypothetical protein
VSDPPKLIRPLHRQRNVRHQPVRILDQQELATLLGVEFDAVEARLEQLGWRFHSDSTGRIWATEQSPPDRVTPDRVTPDRVPPDRVPPDAKPG